MLSGCQTDWSRHAPKPCGGAGAIYETADEVTRPLVLFNGGEIATDRYAELSPSLELLRGVLLQDRPTIYNSEAECREVLRGAGRCF